MLCKTETLQNFTNFARKYMIESLLSKIPSPHSYNRTSEGAITGVFLWIDLCENKEDQWKYFFIASFHASMRS